MSLQHPEHIRVNPNTSRLESPHDVGPNRRFEKELTLLRTEEKINTALVSNERQEWHCYALSASSPIHLSALRQSS